MDRRGVTAFRFDSPDPETTFEIAALLGRSIGARGLALGLVGPLGSGKTVFVKGLAAGLGVDPRGVSSPTFVIAQEYAIPDGPETLHHLDFYRLEYAIHSENFLTPSKLKEYEKRFRERLKSPWTLESDEDLMPPCVIRLDPLHRRSHG